MQVTHQQVVRDGTRVEEHRDRDQDVDETASLELREDQRVCAQRSHRKRKQCAYQSQECRPYERSLILRVAKYRLVSLEVKALGPEINLVSDKEFRAGKGPCQQVQHRCDTYDADEDTDYDEDPVSDFGSG